MTIQSVSGQPEGGRLVYRHLLSTRLWHWSSAALIITLLMSGLMIFNAHPRLYWGNYGANPDPAWLEIGAEDEAGYLRIGDLRIPTTGVLGYSESAWGGMTPQAFPKWATLPGYYDLVSARRWHLSLAWAFAVGTIAFGLLSVANGHLRRDLLPRRQELAPGHIWQECKDHARLKLPCGAAAARYNSLQKLSYLAVIGGLIPLLILTGLCMSPRFNALAPWLLELFGGRQSARSLHFIAAWAMVLFVLVHLAMVLVSGPFNGLRSMITGWFRLPKERGR